MNMLANTRELFSKDYWRERFSPRQQPDLNLTHGMILYLEDISVSFDGFKALNNLNLYIKAGELRCIIGPNGAGKSTMMDVITGKTRPDSGSAWFGQNIDLLSLDEPAIAEVGIGRKFQKPTVFEPLTVEENLELAMAGNKRVWQTFRSQLRGEGRDYLDQVLLLIGLDPERKRLAGVLSHGQKQWLEIGMLLMQRPQLLLVDEPVAGMTHQEMERTAELLTGLAGEHSVLLVEQKLPFARKVGDTFCLLDRGRNVATGAMTELDESLIRAYLTV